MRYEEMQNWINEIASLCQPKNIYYCNGSPEEYESLCQELVRSHTFIPLNKDKRPNSFLCRSDPQDVARVENSTFICSNEAQNAGPTNNWQNPYEMKALLRTLFKGCMEGRTLYVLPFCMGPFYSSFSRFGVQITDSAYVACSMHIMTRMGKEVEEQLKISDFIPCLHSVGKPLKENKADIPWPCNSQHKYIAHFPDTKEIWSFGSGYGGNALLGKKCLGLRIASVLGYQEGWLAEHMLIMGITNPLGEKKYFAAAFPSACGKTNLAMLVSTLPGWKIEIVGDDIAWLKIGKDGRLYAINPEAGFFGVAPGTSFSSNPNAMQTLAKNAIFTNVALTDEQDVWWEGMTKTPPSHVINWLGHNWIPGTEEKAAHPNSRFTVSAKQCPTIDPLWEKEEGVPISALLFGGRRASTIPLVYEAFNWEHGVFLGASISSETTAAAIGKTGQLRHDPFAMLPFCGYHMGDYFQHWLNMQNQTDPSKLPKIYAVNWFRKSKEGALLWPGFGENIQILQWIFARTSNKIEAQKTPIGYIPNCLDINGLNIDNEKFQQLFSIDKNDWQQEVKNLKEYFTIFGNRLPLGIKQELANLEKRISSYKE